MLHQHARCDFVGKRRFAGWKILSDRCVEVEPSCRHFLHGDCCCPLFGYRGIAPDLPKAVAARSLRIDRAECAFINDSVAFCDQDRACKLRRIKHLRYPRSRHLIGETLGWRRDWRRRLRAQQKGASGYKRNTAHSLRLPGFTASVAASSGGNSSGA